MHTSEEIFAEQGLLAEKMPGYTVRPQQVEMVRAVEEAIDSGRDIIVEAGTGVGKSLAYLVPFLLMAMREGKRVVVSTYTKALQNQLFVKDLPFLAGLLEEDIRFAICMGSDNYVCLKKAKAVRTSDLFEDDKTSRETRQVLDWLERTGSGLATDMDFLPERSVWERFAREGDLCRGKRCGLYESCFYMSARRQQAASQILITNHSLLLTDMMSESRILPEYHALVIDEAHTLEDVATTHFGREFSSGRVEHILTRLGNFLKTAAWKKQGDGELEDTLGAVSAWLDKSAKEVKAFFAKAEELFAGTEAVTVLREGSAIHAGLTGALTSLAEDLGKAAVLAGECESAYDAMTYSKRCRMAADDLDFIFSQDNQEYVYWTESRKRRKGADRVFKAAPVEIGGMMRAALFERVSPVLLTSATLTSDTKKKDLSYFKERVGLDDTLEVVLDSPFDYGNNVLMYIPESRIDPARSQKEFRDHIYRNIVAIYEIMKGRMFALFTSYDMMNDITRRIRSHRSDIDIHKQGELPRYVLLDVFKRSRESILMGTATFWQGVDVPGSSLECVIITKLPFAVPNDPVTSARINAIRQRGGDPFHEYQLPKAVLMFKQGFGRLIRSHTDRGVVAVLDPRVNTRKYGREFLSALPECRHTGDIRDVREFFSQ